MNNSTRVTTTLMATGMAALLASSAHAAGPKESAKSTQAATSQIPDVELIDHNGEKVNFYSDLVKGKLVMINAIYTSCPATCPIQSGIFAGVQKRLGDRIGKDVSLISLSLDPVTDTPERLATFAKRYKAKPGWRFLTGDRKDIVEILKAMDLYAADPKDHTPIAVVGNEKSGVWMKVLNLTAPQELITKLEYVEKLTLDQIVNR